MRHDVDQEEDQIVVSQMEFINEEELVILRTEIVGLVQSSNTNHFNRRRQRGR